MDPIGILTIILWLMLFSAIKAGFIGMSILIQHSLPEFIERASTCYTTRSRRWLLMVGLLNGVAIPLISILLISTGVLALPGILLLLIYLWLTLLGYTVVYREIGSKIFDDIESNREVKVTLYGGLVAEASFFTPILGQMFSIFLHIKSLGAITTMLLTRKQHNKD